MPDLACGPATQLAQVAQLNPDISFTGIDLSTNMLSDAEQHGFALLDACFAAITRVLKPGVT